MSSGMTAKIFNSMTKLTTVARVKRVSSNKNSIEVSIKEINAKSFVPLGINNKDENNKKKQNVEKDIKIKFEIKNQDAKVCQIKIFVKGTLSEEPDPLQEINFNKFQGTDMCSPGEYTYPWDGFSDEEVYDSREMSKGLRFVIEVKDDYDGTSTAEEEVHVEYVVRWMDVLIDKKNQEIKIWLRVKFEDGGAIGLKKRIPSSATSRSPYLPIYERTRSFEELIKMAKDGISCYWGRNKGRGDDKNVNIANKSYAVYVDVVDAPIDGDREKYMSEIKLIFNTNGKPMRSRNPGEVRDTLSFLVNMFTAGKVFYNAAYILYEIDGWQYTSNDAADNDFKYAVAHEIGHEILQVSINTEYSYTHKRSSTLTQKHKRIKFCNTGEIDLMQYYENNFTYNDYERIIAAEDDVLNLIGLIKIGGEK